MKVIQLHIADDLAQKVSEMSQDTESFIIETLRTKVNKLKKSADLEKEYKLAAEENKKILQDFATIDLENWSDEY
ncbi:MAG: hypothetical protein KDD21_04540 [Bacteroidetes bacterium]|nr:hypothetical protein [Bacteroidota bacterium]